MATNTRVDSSFSLMFHVVFPPPSHALLYSFLFLVGISRFLRWICLFYCEPILVHLHGLGSIDVSTRISNSDLVCVFVQSFLSLHVSVLFSFTDHPASLCTFPLVDSKRTSSGDLGGAWSKRERPRGSERSSVIVGCWESESSEIGKERIPEEGTMGVTGGVCTSGTVGAEETARQRRRVGEGTRASAGG